MDQDNNQQIIPRRVRCEDCGAEFRNRPWVPGTPCPECHSPRFEPVLESATRSDYETADRSSGFAQEDIRFGRLAKWAELISPKQYQRALFRQSRLLQQPGGGPTLADYLLKEKILNRRQVNAVLKARTVEPGNSDDVEFGLLATRAKLAGEEQVKECRRIQNRTVRSGGDAAPLPLLMLEQRYITEPQVLALVKRQAEHGKGVLAAVRRGIHGERSRREGARAFSEMVALQPVRYSLIALLLLLAAIVFYRSVISPDPTWATVKCAECGAEGGAPADSDWPIECPACKHKSMYPMALCNKCGATFILRDAMGYGASCPKCGSSDYRMVTNEFDLEEAQERIKAEQAASP